MNDWAFSFLHHEYIMNICPSCNSLSVIKKGKDFARGIIKQRYKCKSCEVNFYIEDLPEKEIPSESSNIGKWVITTAINNTETDYEFLETLLSYCKINGAKLLIVPIKYKTDDDYTWDSHLLPYFISENTILVNGLQLLAGINVSPTVVNPLTSFETISKGNSLIIPHPQIMMKCIAVNHIEKSAILHTTGCVSMSNYTQTKSGERANISHSYSAIVVEEDLEIDDFHIRVLNADHLGGFYDLNKYYEGNKMELTKTVPAIVIGDEHVVHIDDEVKQATFTNKDSLISELKPDYIVRHDVLDFYASNHHHKHNFLLQYKKFNDGTNKVEDELIDTIDYLLRTTPIESTSLIVSSNHNDHLTRWLQECNPKSEPWNAKFYHGLMYLMLNDIDDGNSHIPFQLWYKNNYDIDRVQFIKESESFLIQGIEVALHGHSGINGSKGSATQFSKLGMKTIIGHSHTPQIVGDCFQVGHSCKDKMGYNQGPSSWNNAHCIIHEDGSRQMIFIKKGKWKL